MNMSDPEHLSFVEFFIVGYHLQCTEKFSNKDEFITKVVTENKVLANTPDDE